MASSRDSSTKHAITADECWVPAGQDVVLATHRIPGGMLYVGKGLRSVSGISIEPALINPQLAINEFQPDRSGATMLNWPFYHSITAESRAAYLAWLANGRQDPASEIGYVFLYFYGLERRILADALKSEKVRQDYAPILNEIKRLLQIYGGNRSFYSYAMQLQDITQILLSGETEMKPPMSRYGRDLPISVQFVLGRLVDSQLPIPGEWALSWVATHPEVRLPTCITKCEEEFRELFLIRYARQFGTGIVLKPAARKMKVQVAPASASFAGPFDRNFSVTDAAVHIGTVRKLQKLAQDCASELDAFSSWKGRNAGKQVSIAAVALLPAELSKNYDSSEAHRLWQWLEEFLGPLDSMICNSDALLQHCSAFGTGYLMKSESVLLAQLLEKGGFGMEPDVRFGGMPLSPDIPIVLFKLRNDAVSTGSPQYLAATIFMHFAVAVAYADGLITEGEKKMLQASVQDSLDLNLSERRRLAAHLEWLMAFQPNLTGLKKRLELLNEDQRSTIAEFIISVAGSDGVISPAEVNTIAKILPMLGFEPEKIYRYLYAIAASQARGLDSSTAPQAKLQLNMDLVKAKLAESSQLSAILSELFAEEPVAEMHVPAVRGPIGKLRSPYDRLLHRLAQRAEWSRLEFETFSAELNILPDGAYDSINESGFTHLNAPLLEGDDPIYVDVALARELLA